MGEVCELPSLRIDGEDFSSSEEEAEMGEKENEDEDDKGEFNGTWSFKGSITVTGMADVFLLSQKG
jgi:hypothetical protein